MSKDEAVRRATITLYNELTELKLGYERQLSMPGLHPETADIFLSVIDLLDDHRKVLLEITND